MKLFCFGLGFSASALVARLSNREGITCAGTRTRTSGREGAVALAAYAGEGRSADVAALLADTTHVLISIPPDAAGCAALRHFGDDLAALPSLRWVGYLSTVGVYGDHNGAWIDEDTPVNPSSDRAVRRWQAEQAWRAFGQQIGPTGTAVRRVQIFRLPGIYGPGRSVLDTLKSGTAKRVIKPGQVFNRIHVADIANALDCAMACTSQHDLFNITDDEPCPPQDVVTFGAALLGLPPPPEQAFDPKTLSPMAASFYAENKRVRNTRMKTDLSVRLLYPTYREGVRAMLTKD